MKVLVKTDKGLKNLGEGKIFSKSQLRLNEMEISGFLKTAPNIAVAARDATQQINTGKVKQVGCSADDVTNGQANASNGVSKDPTLTTDVKSPDSIKQTQSILNKMTPTEKQNVDVNFVDGTKEDSSNGMVNSSVASRKVMDEMRRNSIPFTKKELHKFLREL